MPVKISIFNDSSLSDSRFSQWLKRSVISTKAYCNFCQKDFDISNMGVAGLTSHAAGKKHRNSWFKTVECRSIFFSKAIIRTETRFFIEFEIKDSRKYANTS